MESIKTDKPFNFFIPRLVNMEKNNDINNPQNLTEKSILQELNITRNRHDFLKKRCFDILCMKDKTTITNATVSAFVCSGNFSATARTSTMFATQTIGQRQICSNLNGITQEKSLYIVSEEYTALTR